MKLMSGKSAVWMVAAASVAVLAFAASKAMAADLRAPAAEGNAPLLQPASAGTASVPDQGAKDFITNMGDQGINFLGSHELTQEQKAAEFKELLENSFDMNTIARFSLGTYWNAATPAQREEYLKLFEQMIVKVYSKRFSDYNGQKFEVQSVRPDGAKDALVTSYIVPDQGQKVRVDWRVRNKGSYKIVDVLVEGVSMAMTQRSDFASVIQRGGGNVDVLLDHLRQQ